VLAIARIITAKRSESLQDAVPHGGIAGKCVENQIDEGVVRVLGVCKDEGTRVDSLSQACA
jgi:hypothetical protein